MRSLLILPVFLSALTTLSAGAIVFQDNFSANGAPGVLPDDTTPGALFAGANFSLTAGSIDLNGPAFYSALCNGTGSSYCIDTTGAGSQRGQITSTSINLADGTYELSFDLMGWSYQGLTETASVNVTLGTLVNQTYSVDGAANPYPLDTIIFTVSTPTAVQLVFTDTGTNDSSSFAGGVLNNIEIQAIPEPATLALGGGALLAIAAFRRRKC